MFTYGDAKLPCFIFDIDGTMALDNGRFARIMGQLPYGGEPTEEHWQAFHETCHEDTPNMPVVAVCMALIMRGHPVLFITGRREQSRTKTAKWLADALCYGTPKSFHDGSEENRNQHLRLFMRANDDLRKDDVIKSEVLDYILRETPFRPVMAFEDRPRVAAMWRERGILVAHVGDWLVERTTDAQRQQEREARTAALYTTTEGKAVTRRKVRVPKAVNKIDKPRRKA